MSESYPLHWPVGWKRCSFRTGAKFTTTKVSLGRTKQKLTIRDGIRRVIDELGRMGVRADDVVISHNVKPHIMDTQGSNVSDPGVAVYWKKRGQPDRVLAVDRYFTVADNLAALAATLDAMRAIERHGGAVVMERAFSGFDALPPPRPTLPPRAWHDVLGIAPNASREQIEAAYREKAKTAHPDAGGTHEAMAALNVARSSALQARGVG